VDDSLGFTVKVFGSYLVDDHPLYHKHRRTMCNVTAKFSEGFRKLEAVYWS